jgi:PAS domain S-box-containing protein
MKGAIIDRFKLEVQRRGLLPPLPEPLLIDGIEDLLERLCDSLEGTPASHEPTKKHAEQRWRIGIDVSALVREYGVLAVSIIAALTDSGVSISADDAIAIMTTVNEAAALSVKQYAKFRDEERERQTKELRVAEAVRDAIINDAPVGVAFLDRDLRFRLINDQLARINGVPREEHLGRTPSEILSGVPAEFLMTQGREVITSGEARRNIEVTGHTPAAPNVERVWAEHWYPVRVGGDVLGVGVLVEDVTERKRIAEFRERLLGTVSHDLRNPLNSIVMSSNLVLMQPDVSESTAGFVRRILTSAKRMASIVEQLFDYVSVDQGSGLPITPAHMDLGELARRVVEESKLAFVGRPDVVLQLDGDLHGEWDETRLGQVLSNLIGNALQHGVGSPIVRLRDADGFVVIEVRNRGRPIPREKLDVLFEPFKGSADKRHLGLGLFIARQIVRAHGGEIRATSGPDSTVFTISLPREARLRATA